jgi:phage/plasmid-like protein (TIGR03299 family)
MAHELLIENGVAAMLYTGDTPWHKNGHKFLSPPSIAEVISTLDADCLIDTRQLHLADGRKVKAFAVVRVRKNGTEDIVGDSVGERFVPIQDTVIANALAPLVDSGAATIETAGYLRGGSRFFVCAKMAGLTAEVVPGDPVQSYACLIHSHDGTLATHAGQSTVRWVCQNTVAAGLQRDGKNMIKIKHTKNAGLAVAEVGELMAREKDTFVKRIEQYQALARKSMSLAQFREFAKLVFPITPPLKAKTVPEPVKVETAWAPATGASILDSLLAAEDAPRTMTTKEAAADREARSVDRLCELFEDGQGNTMAKVRGTAWAGYNAVTQYLTHEAGRTEDNRLLSSNYGVGASKLQFALGTLLGV